MSQIPPFLQSTLGAVQEHEEHRRLVPNNSWSPTGMSTLTHGLQHISGKDHDRRL